MIGIIKRKALIKDLAAAYHAECLALCRELLELQKRKDEVRNPSPDLFIVCMNLSLSVKYLLSRTMNPLLSKYSHDLYIMLVAYRLDRYKTNQSMKPMNKSKDWTLIVDYKVGSGSGLNANNYQGHKIQSGFFLSSWE